MQRFAILVFMNSLIYFYFAVQHAITTHANTVENNVLWIFSGCLLHNENPFASEYKLMWWLKNNYEELHTIKIKWMVSISKIRREKSNCDD